MKTRTFLPVVILGLLLGCGDDEPSEPITVGIEPAAPTVALGQTQQFAAAVIGAGNQAVTWTLDDFGGKGSITPSSLYTAPAGFVRTPAGSFTMGGGSASSSCGTQQHDVTLTHDFWLGRTEGCNDWHACELGTAPVTNPPGPSSGTYRVLRGGSWFNAPDGTVLRCANRNRPVPTSWNNNIGMRVARTIAP